jgi:two-component system, NtrC family, sensor histidine kinase GlrK
VPRQLFRRLRSDYNVKLSIFSRLMIGNLALLTLAMGVAIYAIVELYMVKQVSHSILLDNYLVDLQKELSYALLSETRYEKKFVIMKDRSLRESFLISTRYFEQQLGAANSFAISDEATDILSRVKNHHNQYQKLCELEARYLIAGQSYPHEQFDKAKESVVNAVFAELTKLRSMGEGNIVGKIKKLGAVGSDAVSFAMLLTAISLALGIAISVLITRSITLPLSMMRDKTAEIARGVFVANLNLPSPPEINELAQAFNSMSTKLKEVDRMKSDFFSLMSHELRTPLTSIKEGTNLFLEGKGGEVTERQKRLLTIVSEESNRLIQLVNSLLDLSKLEAGIAAFQFLKDDLAPLITRVIREIEPLAEAKGIRIKRDIQESPRVSMDTERILQVLRNLLGNAIKFTPQGGVIEISLQAKDGVVEVSVTDTGPGIPEEQTAIIFDKFRQAVHEGSRKIQGTGLGLAIVKQIIQSHGGRVWVESAVGRGSTFRFTLPA